MEILVDNILQIACDIEGDCHEEKKTMNISLTHGKIKKIIFEIISSETFLSPHNYLGMNLTMHIHAYVIIFIADVLMLKRSIMSEEWPYITHNTHTVKEIWNKLYLRGVEIFCYCTGGWFSGTKKLYDFWVNP